MMEAPLCPLCGLELEWDWLYEAFWCFSCREEFPTGEPDP